MVTLLAYLYCRQREITDALVDLLIAVVHKINARADTKVTKDFVAELKRVSGKQNILFKMTEAALQSPRGAGRGRYLPVPGGHQTLGALARVQGQGHVRAGAPAAGLCQAFRKLSIASRYELTPHRH